MNSIPKLTMPKARTIPALIEEQALAYTNLDAIVWEGQTYSFGDLAKSVRDFAKGLLAAGIKPGDHVAILMGNRPEWIIGALAISSIRAVMVAVNTWGREPEIGYILAHSDAAAIIYAGKYLKADYTEILENLRGSLPKLKAFIHVEQECCVGSRSFDEISALGSAQSDQAYTAAMGQVTPETICFLIYTSGSTSTPKGVQIQNAPLIENMWYLGNRMHAVPGDRIWMAVSLFWGFGCENALFNSLTHGACLVLQSHFDPEQALSLIERERCTLFYGMGNMVQALAYHPNKGLFDLSSLRSGVMTGTPEQFKAIQELGATEICHMYGFTEGYGNCNVTDGRLDPPEKVIASIGRPLECVVQRVANPETLETCPTGTVGEIQNKYPVTIGYYKDEDKNQAAFTKDGYFRTGDLGYYDEDGFLYFAGRLKELIKTNGINVAPAEIEAVIKAQSGIRDAFVVGVPDAVREEAVAVVIVPHSLDESDQIERRLRAELPKLLSGYKVPRYYKFLQADELPLTATGKVHKLRMPDLFEVEKA
ncbi:class I adenylate-forming enzyme family protein [Martelella soudanensis]|nr:class I adenylate-forming enzyme family protein [Martelella sp. NC18]